MSAKGLLASLDRASKAMAATQDAREYLIRDTREVVILSSRAIIAVHRQDLKGAKENARKASSLLKTQKRRASGELRRYVITPEQELVEAYALIAIAEKRPVPSMSSLNAYPESYILGLLDCIGELKRLAYDRIRTGDASEAGRVFGIMEDLYQQLYPFASFDKIIKEARRKLDVDRVLVEDVRAALTEEIRRSDLIRAMAG